MLARLVFFLCPLAATCGYVLLFDFFVIWVWRDLWSYCLLYPVAQTSEISTEMEAQGSNGIFEHDNEVCMQCLIASNPITIFICSMQNPI